MNPINPEHQDLVEAPRRTTSQEPSDDPTTQLGLDYRLYQLVASDRWTWSKTCQLFVLRLAPTLQIPLSGLGVALATGIVARGHPALDAGQISIGAVAGAVTVTVAAAVGFIR